MAPASQLRLKKCVIQRTVFIPKLHSWSKPCMTYLIQPAYATVPQIACCNPISLLTRQSSFTGLLKAALCMLAYPIHAQDMQLPCMNLGLSYLQAFGPDGLGVITVSDIPKFSEFRSRLLPLASKFAVRPGVEHNALKSVCNSHIQWSQIRMESCHPMFKCIYTGSHRSYYLYVYSALTCIMCLIPLLNLQSCDPVSSRACQSLSSSNMSTHRATTTLGGAMARRLWLRARRTP